MKTTKFGRYFSAGLAVSAALLLVAGCGSGGGTDTLTPGYVAVTTSPGAATGRYQDIVFAAITPKRVFARGEVVPITFTVQNAGIRDATFGFYTTSTQPQITVLPADGTISTETGQLVRLLSRTDPISTAVVVDTPRTITLAPGQSQTLTLQWNQISSEDSSAGTGFAQVAPGVYKIRPNVSVNSLSGVDLPAGLLGTTLPLEIEIQ